MVSREPIAPAVPGSRGVTATTGDDTAVEEFTTVGKGGRGVQFTSEGIFKNLQAVQEARGKKVISAILQLLFTNLLRAEYGPRRTDPHLRETP